MLIKNWGTVEKMQRKLKKLLVLTNICWIFEKKCGGIFGRTWRKFWKSFRKFLRNSGRLWIKFVYILQKAYWNFVPAFQKILEMFDHIKQKHSNIAIWCSHQKNCYIATLRYFAMLRYFATLCYFATLRRIRSIALGAALALWGDRISSN